MAETGKADGVLVCPQGFVADHLEVAYDLDIEAAAVAREVGLAFARTRVLNADPTVFAALAQRVLDLADGTDRTDRSDGANPSDDVTGPGGEGTGGAPG